MLCNRARVERMNRVLRRFQHILSARARRYTSGISPTVLQPWSHQTRNSLMLVHCLQRWHNIKPILVNVSCLLGCTMTDISVHGGIEMRYLTGIKIRYLTGIQIRYLTWIQIRNRSGIHIRNRSGIQIRYPTGIQIRYLSGIQIRYLTGNQTRYLTGIQIRQVTHRDSN